MKPKTLEAVKSCMRGVPEGEEWKFSSFDIEAFAAIIRKQAKEEDAEVCLELDQHRDHLHPNDCAEAIRKSI